MKALSTFAVTITEAIPQNDFRELMAEVRKFAGMVDQVCIDDQGQINGPIKQVYDGSGNFQEFVGTIASRSKKIKSLMLHDSARYFQGFRAAVELLFLIKDFDASKKEALLEAMRNDFFVMQNTIESTYFWTGGEFLKDKTANLVELLKQLQPTFFNRKTSLKISDDSKKVNCKFHEATFINLLFNMLGNAKNRGWANEIEIKVMRSGNFLEIAVSDDGKGVDDSVASEIFDEGVSGEGSTGLGLAFGRERMASFGGAIECESHGGLPNSSGNKGAKFVLYLPIVSDDKNSNAQPIR